MKNKKRILATLALVMGATFTASNGECSTTAANASGAGLIMTASYECAGSDTVQNANMENIIFSTGGSVMQDSTLVEYVQERVETQKEIAAKVEQKQQRKLEKKLKREAKERAERERQEQIDSITANPDNVTELSNLTEEQFHIMTKGTWWEGNEWILMEIESQHHINAMFAMSVSTLESGCGTTWRARTKQNYYGAEVPTYFDGLYDSSMYFGDFLNRLYIEEGLISVWAIGPKYCPPNRNWEVYMYDYMNKLKNKVVETVR